MHLALRVNAFGFAGNMGINASHAQNLFVNVFRPTNLVKSRSREIECYNDRFALKFDRHLGSVAAEVLVKFKSN